MNLSLSHGARRARRLVAGAVCATSLLATALMAAPLAAPRPAKAAPTMLATASAATAPDAELRERIEKIEVGIAGLHRTRAGGLKCEKCHGDVVAPDDNQTVENRECIACHEGYAEMAKVSAKKLTNQALNAHASHLGAEIACTACHQGHQESKAYCLNCHTNFEMTMPGNARPASR